MLAGWLCARLQLRAGRAGWLWLPSVEDDDDLPRFQVPSSNPFNVVGLNSEECGSTTECRMKILPPYTTTRYHNRTPLANYTFADSNIHTSHTSSEISFLVGCQTSMVIIFVPSSIELPNQYENHTAISRLSLSSHNRYC